MKVNVTSKRSKLSDLFDINISDMEGNTIYDAVFAYPTNEPVHTERVSRAYVKMCDYEFAKRGWEVNEMR